MAEPLPPVLPPSAPHHKHAFRHDIWETIEYGKGFWGKLINSLIFLFILLSLIILPLELIPDLHKYHLIAEIFEIIVTSFFTIEYLLLVYAAPSRLGYIFSWWGIIDLLSIAPYFVYRANTQIFRFARIGRVVRILKIAHMKATGETEIAIKEKSTKVLRLVEGEEIQKVVLQHPVFFLIGLILPLALTIGGLIIILIGNFHQVALTGGVVLFLLALLFLYKGWLDYHYDVMYLTNLRIIFQNKHIFGSSFHHIEYPFITNIRPTHTGIWSFLLGYGSIAIDTASDLAEIVHKNARDHEKVAQEIHEYCQEYKVAQSQVASTLAGMQKAVDGAFPQPAIPRPPSGFPPPQSSPPQNTPPPQYPDPGVQ